MGGGVSKSELDNAQNQLNEAKKQAEEQGNHNAELNERVKTLSDKQQDYQRKLEEEKNDQPSGDFAGLQRESVQHHGLDASKCNLLIFGTTKAGKSTLGNYLSGTDSFDTRQTPVRIAGSSQSAECTSHGLEGCVIYDVEGSGTDSNEARQMVKTHQPAGFDAVLIAVGDALMNEDAAMARFCHHQGIRWYIIKTQMDITLLKSDQTGKEAQVEEAHQRYMDHFADMLAARQVDRFHLEDRVFFVDSKSEDTQLYDNQALIEALAGLRDAKAAGHGQHEQHEPEGGAGDGQTDA